ncbi:fumarylacetoacetate hydrolase family protein [Povalibacter sp.]|uniref:fumarylacetoacetate hydrolase family protein n=1 Tax=Povalibacter sp. TaxID=1962978 RepID=UPI002F41C673
MRLCRFDQHRLGVVLGDSVADVSAVLDTLPSLRWPLPAGDQLIANLARLRPLIEQTLEHAPRRALADCHLDSPVANPTKIIGAPVNYQKHIDEARADRQINVGNDVRTIDYYGLFLKANSSLVGQASGVTLPFADRRHDHEGELAVIIGRECRGIIAAQALDHVAGYSVALDMTVRGSEDRSFRKSPDTYSVLGPWLVTRDEIADPGDLELWLQVNGVDRQRTNTRHLIYDVPQLIEYAAAQYTLYPGDIIMTGTPEGVGPVVPGDVIEAGIGGIGALRVTVSGQNKR